MDKKINHILQKPLYPYFYGLAFIAFKSSQYFPSFSLLSAVNSLFLFCISCYIINWLISKFSRSAYTGISILLIWGSLLHVVGVALILGYHYSYIPIGYYVTFYLVVSGIIIVVQFISSKTPAQYAPSLNKLMNFFLLICSIVFVVNGFVYGGWKKETNRKPLQTAYKQVDTVKRKDILWILVDEYASSASLQQQFAFHNPLDSVLKEQGFCVLPAIKSRFNNTLFSLNAIFGEDDSTKPSGFYSGVRLLRKNSWVPLLETAGYQIVNLGFFDIGKHTKLANRSGYPETYIDQLLSGTLFSIVYNSLKYTPEKCDRYNQEVLHRLDDTLFTHAGRPKFIWAHIGLPHEPFCRNSHGDFSNDRTYDESDADDIKKSYTEYLQYGNSVIIGLLKNHPDLSQKIVIISGDHGPRFSFLKDKSYQKWPFAAVHLPGKFDTAALRNLQYISQLPDFIMDYLSPHSN